MYQISVNPTSPVKRRRSGSGGSRKEGVGDSSGTGGRGPEPRGERRGTVRKKGWRSENEGKGTEREYEREMAGTSKNRGAEGTNRRIVSLPCDK